MLFVNYPKCSTCKKAKAFLDNHAIDYEDRNIKEENPTEDKLDSMDDAQKIKLLATDGMLVKRPILVTDSTVLVGFKEKEWENVL